MAWCEMNQVDFVFGFARNARLVEEISVELLQAEAEASSTGKPARRFKDFRYATLDCWSRQRRVVAKAEWTKGEANPRRRVAEKTRQSNPRPTGDPQKTDPIRANRARDALVLTTVTAQLLSGRERPSPSYERCGLACRREY